MPHPKDNEIYFLDTVVRLKKTGQFAIIRKYGWQSGGRGFLNYLAEIEGRNGLFAIYHEDCDLEVGPICDLSEKPESTDEA